MLKYLFILMVAIGCGEPSKSNDSASPALNETDVKQSEEVANLDDFADIQDLKLQLAKLESENKQLAKENESLKVTITEMEAGEEILAAKTKQEIDSEKGMIVYLEQLLDQYSTLYKLADQPQMIQDFVFSKSKVQEICPDNDAVDIIEYVLERKDDSCDGSCYYLSLLFSKDQEMLRPFRVDCG